MGNTACTFLASEIGKFSFGFDFTDHKCIALKLQLAQYINDMYKAGVREFYSVCEQGVDLWAAEIVTFLMQSDEEVKLFCILPYEEQAAKWHPDIHELYYRVLEQATEVEHVGTRYEEDCLAEARYRTLDCCANVFAVVYDGKDNEYVRYSMVRGKEVCVI